MLLGTAQSEKLTSVYDIIPVAFAIAKVEASVTKRESIFTKYDLVSSTLGKL